MKRLLFSLLLFVISTFVSAQTYTLQGIVKNKKTDEVINSANVTIDGLNIGTVTDSNGKFLLENISSKKSLLIVSHINFLSDTTEITLIENSNKILNIFLSQTTHFIGEAVVTSTKYRKKIKDVSLPIEIVSEKEIETYLPLSLSDAIDRKPGLTISRDGSWSSRISIRGLSRQNIVTLVDGNRIETATNIAAGMSLVDVNDIERIEVIKGAASSLYGSGALGGVVNIITKSAGFQNKYYLHGFLNSSYSSVNNGGNGNLSINTGSSNWFAKISGTMRSADNYETPEGILNNSQFRDNNLSANIGFKPAENHEIDLKYQRFYAEDVGIPGGTPFPSAAKASYPEEKREMYSLEYRVNNLVKSMSNLSVKYFYQTIDRRVELIPNANAIVNPNGDHKTTGIQLQTNWLLSKSNIFIAGLDIWQRNMKTWRTKYIIPKNQIVGEIPVPESDYRSIGVFAQDEMQIIENKLQLTLGGRIDQIKVTNEESYNPDYIIVDGVRNDSPPTQVKLWNAEETDDISASANLGLLYRLNEEVDLTLNVARSFRSPNLEERFQFIQLGGATYWGNPDLEPEKGTFFDFGVRMWSPKISLSANVFVNYLNNLVIDEWQSDDLYVKNNVGESRFYGFDFSVDCNVYKELVLMISGAYVRGEDTQNNVDLPEVPPLNGQLGVKFPIANYLDVEILSIFYSDQNNPAPNENETDGYARFDLYASSASINLGSFGFRLFTGIENIFDKAYRNHLSTYRGLLRLEPGRNVFLKLALNF